MHPNPRRILPVLLILVVLVVAIYYALPAFSGPSRLILSGTIEATEVKVAAEIGGRVSFVTAEEGQAVTLDQILLELHPRSGSGGNTERVRSPIDGVVLYRSIEPGEIASPGAPLLTVADLSRLTLIVYAPEDQYGRIHFPASVLPAPFPRLPARLNSPRATCRPSKAAKPRSMPSNWRWPTRMASSKRGCPPMWTLEPLRRRRRISPCSR
jgi:multidrug efflux pump subunit AcrA (membrane-fusion protein)